MENRRHNPHQQSPQPADQSGQSGFSLIEIMVVIAVMGAISAAIVVNWSSFMRHQELRQDAVTLHKEILALKARAIEYGYDDMLACPAAGSCTITWYEPSDDDVNIPPLTKTKVITVNNGVTIEIPPDNMPIGGDLTVAITGTNNKWKNAAGKVEIKVKPPENLEAYESGRILLSKTGVKASYCIQKDESGVRPELYHRSTASSSWKRM